MASVHEVFHFAWDVGEVNGAAKNDEIAGFNEWVYFAYVIPAAFGTALGFVTTVIDLSSGSDVFLSEVN